MEAKLVENGPLGGSTILALVYSPSRCLLLLLALSAVWGSGQTLSPSIKGMTNLRRELVEGEDLLLTCVVKNVGANTVIWSKFVDGRRSIIAIDKLRVHHDSRIAVLHDEAPYHNSSIIRPGGDVWVLSIKNVTLEDSGGYVCRINSVPWVENYYSVGVKLVNSSVAERNLRSHHNYTSCCVDQNVAAKCLGFCNLHDILEGNTGIEPEKCETQFPQIVECMADFRDHTSCCEKQGIPDICQDLCRGEYTIQDDYLKSHFSCTIFTEATLLCISEGIDILPRPPRAVSVRVVSPFALEVEWDLPEPSSPPYDHFLINVTTLHRFDEKEEEREGSGVGPSEEDSTDLAAADHDPHFAVPKKMQIMVGSNQTWYRIEHLSPLTWYEVKVTSVNRHGASMTQYNVRVLTLPVSSADSQLETKNISMAEAATPALPDVRACCLRKGVQHTTCLENLCDPKKMFIDKSDLIMCAAWAESTFSCLTGGIDHSDCCRLRGLPDICIDLCTGNVTKIDYKYFRCVNHFSDYKSCLMQGYGVLASSPERVQVTNIHPTFALLTWDPPMENKESVTSYYAYYRPINPRRSCEENDPVSIGLTYFGISTTGSSEIMEKLCPDTKYEVYITAMNAHGSSRPSERIIFHTKAPHSPPNKSDNYNVTECCASVNLSPACKPLCGYNIRMSHYRSLSNSCSPEMSKIFRCIVGGRDHSNCCSRRGVPISCLSLCIGNLKGNIRTPVGCFPYLGNIMMCLEEGVQVLPGPVSSLHATEIVDGGVTLQWDPPKDSANVSYYQVNYQIVNKLSSTHAIFNLNNTLNSTQPFVVVDGLQEGEIYNLLVISVNDFGTSLPSSILTINVTKVEERRAAVPGVPSAPHSLLLEGKSATSLTILWQPPTVALPTDRIRYTLHYASLNVLSEGDPEYNSTGTSITAAHLKGLSPNTQHIIFVTASNDFGESRPSETLLAWTDPAYPAFVETPTVHPSNQIIEGDSMTILCIAMGSPLPKVSLFISGILMHQDVTRHMVTVVKNVSRSMTEISCYADNGYGTPMQSKVSITVSYRPKISAIENVKVVAGSEVTLKCHVNAWPEPSMIWWKDAENRIPVIHGGNISLAVRTVAKGNYTMSLTMKYAEESEFYCHASNSLGLFTYNIKVSTWQKIRQPLNISQCCAARNVSSLCISACDFDQIDYHKQINEPRCIPDFPKLLYCGADMSDHRGCCSKKGVPDYCLDWCRSKALDEDHHTQVCLLQWAPPIFDCFLEGRETLPGPPQNVQFKVLTETSAEISWDVPLKNADKVEMYRVFWREKGTRMALKNDTQNRSIRIYNITEGLTYEVAVKAGNRLGTSILTKTRIFTHTLPSIFRRSTAGSNPAGVAVGICVAIVLLGLAGAGWWVVRKKQLLTKGVNGISFENPSYIREQSGDAVQIAETPNGSLNGNIGTGMNVPLTNGGLSTLTSNGPTFMGTIDNPSGNGTVWNTQTPVNTNLPGFESDLEGKGGYKRFKS